MCIKNHTLQIGNVELRDKVLSSCTPKGQMKFLGYSQHTLEATGFHKTSPKALKVNITAEALWNVFSGNPFSEPALKHLILKGPIPSGEC